MNLPVTVKVCGLTREEDIAAALSLGADFIGINLYEPSPRSVSPARARELLDAIPEGKRVLVDVSPSTDQLTGFRDLGFDAFQIHFDLEVGLGTVAAWSGIAGRENLWLAPRIPPGERFPEMALEFADTLLFDAFSKSAYGGTGRTADWQEFRRLSEQHPAHTWILSGGLNPDNAIDAVSASGSTFIDVNSGVESSPGIKDPDRLARLMQRIGRD